MRVQERFKQMHTSPTLGRCKVVIAVYVVRPGFVYASTSVNAACRCD